MRARARRRCNPKPTHPKPTGWRACAARIGGGENAPLSKLGSFVLQHAVVPAIRARRRRAVRLLRRPVLPCLSRAGDGRPRRGSQRLAFAATSTLALLSRRGEHCRFLRAGGEGGRMREQSEARASPTREAARRPAYSTRYESRADALLLLMTPHPGLAMAPPPPWPRQARRHRHNHHFASSRVDRREGRIVPVASARAVTSSSQSQLAD